MGIFVLALIGAGTAWYLNELRKDRARERQARLREAEIDAALPLAVFGDESDVNAAKAAAASLVSEYDGLRSFSDAQAWDLRAIALVEDVDAVAERVVAFQQRSDRELSEAGPDAWARVEKTRRERVAIDTNLGDLRRLRDDLLERVDLTPDDKSDRAAMLRDLRAEKKDLALQKREARALAAEARREARALSVQAGARAWTPYDRRVAASERRRIRRALEAVVQPHESDAAALDRQIAALERRINWLSRFGEE